MRKLAKIQYATSSIPVAKCPAYKIPSSVYERALSKIKAPVKKDKGNRGRCHQSSYKRFNRTEAPTCRANFSEAVKQSFEDRNFKALYETMNKALELRDISLLQQIHQYFEAAINADPQSMNKDKLRSDYLSRIKLLDGESDQYWIKSHLLCKNLLEEND